MNMKFEVNGEWIETHFYFWLLTILIDLFTFCTWVLATFLVVAAITNILNIKPSDSPLWIGIFIGCVIFGSLWGFIIGFGVLAVIGRYLK